MSATDYEPLIKRLRKRNVEILFILRSPMAEPTGAKAMLARGKYTDALITEFIQGTVADIISLRTAQSQEKYGGFADYPDLVEVEVEVDMEGGAIH